MSDPTHNPTVVTVISRITERPAAKQACLVVIYGGELGKKFNIESQSTLLIGRSSKADVHVDQESVSRNHCKIVNTGKTALLRDLGSTNGTYVNDDPVDEHVLRDGDLVKIGRTIFKFLTGANIEHAYHEEIYRLTTVDGLTQVYNKRYFMEVLEREIDRSQRYARELSLIMFDVDHFKQVNDDYGHLAGDHVLKHLASVIKARIRREDIMARYGGQEFAIMLPEIEHGAAIRFSEKIRALVENTEFRFEDARIPITISMGADAVGKATAAPDMLIESTRRCLSEAKRAGRNCVVGHVPGVASPSVQGGDIEPQSPPPLQQRVKTIPELWLKKRVVEHLAGLTTGKALVVGACALRDHLALLKDAGRPILERLKELLLDVLGDQLGEAPSIWHSTDVAYVYVTVLDSKERIESLRLAIDASFDGQVASISLAPRHAGLCQGFAVTTDSQASVNELIATAMSNLDVAPAEQGLAATLPHPIPAAMEAITGGPHERLGATYAAVETILRFLANLVLTVLFDKERADQLPGPTLDILAQMVDGPLVMGKSRTIVEKTLKEAEKHEWGLLSKLASSFKGSGKKRRNLHAILQELIEERNTSHWRLARGDSGAEPLLAKIDPLLAELVKRLSILKAYRLATVTELRLDDKGAFVCTFRDHTGPGLGFPFDDVVRDQPLRNETYLLARDSDEVIQLSPLVIMAHCQSCNRAELFWTKSLLFEEETDYVSVCSGHPLKHKVSVDGLHPVLRGQWVTTKAPTVNTTTDAKSAPGRWECKTVVRHRKDLERDEKPTVPPEDDVRE